MCEQDMFDGTCWESARSSWIYMEMEPKPHRSACLQHADVSGLTEEMSLDVNLDDIWPAEEDRTLEFVEGQTAADTEEDGDYEEICEDPCYVAPHRLALKTETCAPARRSVSLDSYPLPKKCLLKQSESFPHRSRPLTSPGIHTPLDSPDTYPSRPLTSPDPLRSRPAPDPLRPLVPTDSVMSVCTTVSAATSCGSLYRIPAKVRKLSSNSTWSAISSKHLFPAAHPAQALKAPSSLLPKLLRDVFYFLWCENPDRDPFNTFSVSETDLTAAISHLEQQLSTRIRHQDERSRASLFSTFINSHNSEPGSQSKEPGSVSSQSKEPVPESDDDVSVGPAHSLPFRLQFIMESYCNIYMLRKQDLRELKLLQKQENKQITDLSYKNHLALEAKEKKFDTDSANLKKTFDQDLDMLIKQQKQLIEKAEWNQQNDMKNAAKKLKAEQDKELKMFREKQKQEMKLLKQELDMLPRDNKKETAQKMRESKQIEMEEKERLFMENQNERMEKHMRQLADQHRQKIAMLESQCLQQKQQLYRSREANIWEMEKSQLHERHQLMKTQLKDMFFVKRHQMLTRHQKEMENLKRYNQTKEDEMMNRHALERRRLPKILKSEAKTRAQMFKQSLRLSTIGTPEDDKVKIKQFEESEKKRMKSEQMRQEEKHKRQLKALQDKNDAAVKELEQLQAEKRKMLMEQETQKIKELDDQFNADMTQWKAMLIPRKQALEEQFQRETEEQQSFYADVVSGDAGIPSLPSIRSNPSTIRSKGRGEGSNYSRHSTVI